MEDEKVLVGYNKWGFFRVSGDRIKELPITQIEQVAFSNIEELLVFIDIPSECVKFVFDSPYKTADPLKKVFLSFDEHRDILTSDFPYNDKALISLEAVLQRKKAASFVLDKYKEQIESLKKELSEANKKIEYLEYLIKK